jgi:hypothetical protein
MTMFWLEIGCSHWKVTWQMALIDEFITLIPETYWEVPDPGLKVPLPLVTPLLFQSLLEPCLVVVTERWSE